MKFLSDSAESEEDAMPTYDYRCDDCNHAFEKFQGIKEPVLTECPVCQGRVKRLIGAGAGLIFKGSGFYITDYRSQDYAKRQKAESEAASPKTESKSETKKESSSTPASAPVTSSAKSE